jgi:acetyl esterase/lipase
MGDKMGGAGMAFKDSLLSAGYAFASINYRLAPKYVFPAQIEDVKCAVRFFRAHAAVLALDPDRIAALGGSAGGHLVALLGLTSGEDLWEDAGQYLSVSSEVAAVVDLFGPTDLSPLAEPVYRDMYADVFGQAVESDADMWRFSPLAYVSPEAPPFLILHGDADPVVFLHHSERLYQALMAVDVPAELVVVEGGGHSTDLFRAGASPNLEAITEMLLAFLQEHLD